MFDPHAVRGIPASHYPGDLWVASRWILRTRSEVLRSAREYLKGNIIWPLKIETGTRGARYISDQSGRTTTGISRVREIAAAIVMIADAGIDPNVLYLLRETPWVDDRDAFAAAAMGMSPAEALRHVESDTLPDRAEMLALAALRAVPLNSIYDETPTSV